MDSMASSWKFIIPGIVLLACIIISICSFVLLIPLNTIPAITGVSIIISVAYALSFIAWMIVVGYYSSKPDELVWLNTHLMFLILFPATIAATAMNVTSIQNTRNLLAMQLSS
jgi:hypothetical protein